MLVDSDGNDTSLEHVATACMPYVGACAALAGTREDFVFETSTNRIVDGLRTVVRGLDFATDADGDEVAANEGHRTDFVDYVNASIVTRRNIQLVVDWDNTAALDEVKQQSEALAVAVGFDLLKLRKQLHPKGNITT